MKELPSIIQEVIAVVEWVKWDESEQHLSTVMPIMLEEKRNVENEEIIKTVWQALTVDDISTRSIQYVDAKYSFPYLNKPVEEIDPTVDGQEFYIATWGDN